DPRLATYEGVLPGFDADLDLTGDHVPWLEWLAALGYDTSVGLVTLLSTEHERPAEHSLTTFMTDRVLDWLGANAGEPWFLHLSSRRPHPPYSAPGEWSRRYDPAELTRRLGPPTEPLPAGRRPPFHDLVLQIPEATAPGDPDEMA